MDTPSLTDWLTASDIERPLCRMTGADVRLTGDWSCDRFKDGLGETLGVWRVAGSMITREGEQPWSLVLKGWDCSKPSGATSAALWPWRESHLYQSHLLESLPGVSAPRCHGSVKRDEAQWVWLDDLTVFPQPEWTVERFARAAQRLGQFNGAYLAGRPIPEHAGLSQRWLEGWVAADAGGMQAFEEHRDHPRVREVLPPDVASAFTRIWERRGATYDTLRSMPRVFAHLDAFPPNIFFRELNGEEEMVLIDWSFAGIAAPGEELAALCFAGPTFNPALMPIIDAAEEAAFEAYIEGLREAGWRGDEADVWAAYRSSALLRYGPGAMSKWLQCIIDDELIEALTGMMGFPLERYVAFQGEVARWIAEHADDA